MGQALDTNTQRQRAGLCAADGLRVVRIFRKHSFAWGGNFLTPDGMHFEWVGEPRDQFPYPSRYCPNAGVATPRRVDAAADSRLSGDAASSSTTGLIPE